jgi:hypothetical protein
MDVGRIVIPTKPLDKQQQLKLSQALSLAAKGKRAQ